MTQVKQTLAGVVAAGLVGIAVVSIAIIPTGGSGASFEIFAAGYLIGSVFGNAVTASAWAALGPGPFLLRLVLSIIWTALVSLAVFGNAWMNGIPLSEGTIVALCIMGMWLLAQIPYWLLKVFGDLTLSTGQTEVKQDRPQYGIGRLLIFTAIVAIIFGVGRAAAGFLPTLGDLGGFTHVLPFLFLTAAAVLLSLPLPLAILLPRFAGLAILAMFSLTALATLVELPLLNQLSTGPGPQFMHFVWINAFTAGWILALGWLVRFAGYRLATRGKIIV